MTRRDGFDGVKRIEATTLRPRAQALLDKTENAMHIHEDLDIPVVIDDWLHAGGLSVLYGAPNVGKTFLALDIANHVQRGEQWAGRHVEQGNVLYIAAEGGANFRNRVAALHDRSFWVLPDQVNVAHPSRQHNDAGPIRDMVLRLADSKGPFSLIIFDTMARVMGDADENAGADIRSMLGNLDFLRKETGAHTMLIHHCGKDPSKGLRGHSSLLGAIDTEIRVTREDDRPIITAKATKQRDMPANQEFHYRLEQVELGKNRRGKPVTTCIVIRQH